MSFSFLQLNVTGLKSLIKLNPAVVSEMFSFNLMSEGADIEVAPNAIAESFPAFPMTNVLAPLPTTLCPIAIS